MISVHTESQEKKSQSKKWIMLGSEVLKYFRVVFVNRGFVTQAWFQVTHFHFLVQAGEWVEWL